MEICVAMDISSSTVGEPLEAEIAVIKGLLTLRDKASEIQINVLPWTVTPHEPIQLPNAITTLSSLNPDSGTTPSCLYQREKYVEALKRCGIWFLLTDGGIDEKELKAFTMATMEHSIHDKAVVVVFFGSKDNVPIPGDLDVSSGISIFALAYQSLFLFTDVSSRETYIIQAKGCFKALLGHYPQPIFTDSTLWGHLPRMDYATLANIQLPAPKSRSLLSKNKIALEHNFILDPRDVYTNTLAPVLVTRVTTPTHLRTLSIIEVSLGTSDGLSDWLAAQLEDIPDKMDSALRLDVSCDAKRTLTAVLELIRDGIAGEIFEDAQANLRNAHEVNWRYFRTMSVAHNEHQAMTHNRNAVLRQAHKDLAAMKAARFTSVARNLPRNIFPARIAFPNKVVSPLSIPLSADFSSIFTPGFICTPKSNLIGTCTFCNRGNSLMTLLLKAIPPTTFPLQDAYSHTPFTLDPSFPTRLPELKGGIKELISSKVCCDMCGFHIATSVPKEGNDLTMPVGRIVAAIPCVGFSGKDEDSAKNAKAVMDILGKVFCYGVRREDVLGVWVRLLEDSNFTEMVRQGGEMKLFGMVLGWFLGESKRLSNLLSR
jgi:uncharacterized protein (DUF2267 family)